MPPLASPIELSEYLGTQISPSDSRALRVLQTASDLVVSEAGQQIEAVSGDAVTLNGSYGKTIYLPQLPVTAVSAVSVDGAALTAANYSWTRTGKLYRTDGGSWGNPETKVAVTYDHGYATIPGDLKAVTLSAAARLWGQPDPGIASESVGDYQITYARSTDGGGLLSHEAAVCRRYRRKHLSIPIYANR